MFILAAYGYKQGQIYNINCQTAPLIDAIKKQAYADIISLLNTKQIQILKEIEETSLKLEHKQKKLYKLENPPEEEVKEITSAKSKFRSGSDAKEIPKPEESQEEIKKVEEVKEPKKSTQNKNDKPKKEDNKKGIKKPPEEVKELSPEEIRLQKLEAEKDEIRKQIAEIQAKKDKLNEKLELLKSYKEKYVTVPKEIDLIDQNGNRKFLKTRSEDLASSFLNTRVAYQVAIIEDNDSYQFFDIDGYCIRTVEEDINYVEEPDSKGKMKSKQQAKKK
jgi:chromosome segregation ATPase